MLPIDKKLNGDGLRVSPYDHLCDEPCRCTTEIYSRITGYYSPVVRWNKGKQEEFKDRKEYRLTHTGEVVR